MRIADQLHGKRYDAVVIGLGINGASALRELALAGYSVLGVDMQDFGTGSSSRSSRLLHCGLRYLAPGRSAWEFARHPQRLATALKMARQAVVARSEFARSEPNRVSAMKLHFPIYAGGPYATWQVRSAFGMLGAMNVGGIPLDYSMMRRASAVRAPMVNLLSGLDRLRAVATYREYQMVWPERVCVDAVLDAVAAGATALNYTRVESCQRSNEGTWCVRLGGTDDGAGQWAEVRAPVVLNMAGIWIDDVLRTAQPWTPRKVLGTKGAHILVRMPEECRGLGIATMNSKGEPFYCLPWGAFHYFGPTETVYEGDKTRVVVTADEIEFLLSEANRLFPARALRRSDIVHTWAGVRPLTYDEKLPAGNRNRVLHDLAADGLDGMLALTAGPVMTHRSGGREVRAAVDSRIGAPATNRQPLPDAHPPIAPDFLRKLRAGAPEAAQLLGEIVSKERVRTLADLFFRRLGLAWFDRVEPADVQEAARISAVALGWSEADTRTAVSSFLHELDAEFGYRVAEEAMGHPTGCADAVAMSLEN